MKKNFLLLVLILWTALCFSPIVNAQNWTCSDLTWSEYRLANTPNIASHCLDVVERRGVPYAQLRARVQRQALKSTFVSYQSPDGKWSASERVFPGDFTASIGGEDVKISELPDRQEINVYVTAEGNFSYPQAARVTAVEPEQAPAPAPAPVFEPVPATEPAPVSLPATATQQSLYAWLGGLLIVLGGMVAVTRSRL